MKTEMKELLYDLLEEVQAMREEGETDLRTVVHMIQNTITDLEELDND